MQPSKDRLRLVPLPFLPLILVGAAVPLVSTFAAVFIVIAIMQLVSGVGADTVQTWLAQPEGRDASADFATETGGLILEATVLACAVLLASRRDRQLLPTELAWTPWHKDRSLLPFIAIMVVWQAIDELVIEPAVPSLAELRRMPVGTPALLVSLLATVIIAPVAEELFFRGFVYTNLRAQAGALPTIAIVALLNAFMHFGISFAVATSLLPLALICGMVRERYASVRPAIYLHAISNIIGWGDAYLGFASG